MSSTPPTAATRSLLVVEDDPFLRDLLVSRLRQSSLVAWGVANAAEALRVFQRRDPDGVLVDLHLGQGPNGAQLVERLRQQNPALPIVFLTSYTSPRLFPEAPSIGSSPYLVKSRINDFAYVLTTLDRALRGLPMLPEDRPIDPPGISGLTDQQVVVLRLIASGLSNAQIAEHRGTSLRAAEQLVSKALKRAGIDEEASAQHRIILAQRAINPYAVSEFDPAL